MELMYYNARETDIRQRHARKRDGWRSHVRRGNGASAFRCYPNLYLYPIHIKFNLGRRCGHVVLLL